MPRQIMKNEICYTYSEFYDTENTSCMAPLVYSSFDCISLAGTLSVHVPVSRPRISEFWDDFHRLADTVVRAQLWTPLLAYHFCRSRRMITAPYLYRVIINFLWPSTATDIVCAWHFSAAYPSLYRRRAYVFLVHYCSSSFLPHTRI